MYFYEYKQTQISLFFIKICKKYLLNPYIQGYESHFFFDEIESLFFIQRITFFLIFTNGPKVGPIENENNKNSDREIMNVQTSTL